MPSPSIDTFCSPFRRIRALVVSSTATFGILAMAAVLRLCLRLGDGAQRTTELAALSIAVIGAGIGVGLLSGIVLGTMAAISGLLARAVGDGVSGSEDAWRRARNFESTVAAIAFHPTVLAVYGAGYDKIHRAINFVHRRLVHGVAYELSPERLPWLVVSLIILPLSIVAFFGARRMIDHLATTTERRSVGSRIVGLAVLGIAVAIDGANASFGVNIFRFVHVIMYLFTIVLVHWTWLAHAGSFRRRAEAILARPEGIAGVTAVGFLALSATHVVMTFDYSVESLVFMRTTTARENVRFLRSLWDRDRDGASPLFGGDDPDDGDASVGPWTIAPSHRFRPSRARRAPEPVARVDFVLLVTVDALRADMIDGGGETHMPYLRSFAETATRFDNAYSQAPFTNASFRSIFSSSFPCEIEVDRPSTTLAEQARGAGITSTGIVPSLFKRLGFDSLGFDRFDATIDDTRGTPTAADTTEKALAEMGTWHAGQRRILWAHYFDPHTPADSTDSDATAWDLYATAVQKTDREIGRLLAFASGRSDLRIAIVIGADHGDEFGDHGAFHHGFSLYEASIRVPLIVGVPNMPPRRIATPVENIDLAPTIAELMGVVPHRHWRGFSLLPLIEKGEDPGFHQAIVAETEGGLIAFVDPVRRLKLIEHRLDGFHELYDLVADPGETHNLADRRSADLAEMRRGLADWAASRGVTIEAIAQIGH